jgi:hypothetical protein
MTLKTIYGHPVKDLANAVIVSSEKAKQLLEEGIEHDKRNSKWIELGIVKSMVNKEENLDKKKDDNE